jgi:hypothetical protein
MTARIGNALQGAFLLARGRPEGLLLIAAPADAEMMAAAARSFLAAVLCLPAFLCLHLLDWTTGTMPQHPAQTLSMDLVGYAIGWAGFAVASHGLAGLIGRERTWPRFIAAWNWCNVVQYLMLVAAAVPALVGAPWFLVQTAWMVALGWALWLEWYASRLALDVPGGVAAGFVLLDFALGLLVAAAMG